MKLDILSFSLLGAFYHMKELQLLNITYMIQW